MPAGPDTIRKGAPSVWKERPTNRGDSRKKTSKGKGKGKGKGKPFQRNLGKSDDS